MLNPKTVSFSAEGIGKLANWRPIETQVIFLYICARCACSSGSGSMKCKVFWTLNFGAVFQRPKNSAKNVQPHCRRAVGKELSCCCDLRR